MTLSLAVDGRQRRFAVKLQSFPQGLPDLLRVCQHTRGAASALLLLLWRRRVASREASAAPTFVREPPGLRSDADGPAVLLVLRRATQIVPHALCADPAQVGALRLDALVHSLLLGGATRQRNH